jgi:hypothetical protein
MKYTLLLIYIMCTLPPTCWLWNVAQGSDIIVLKAMFQQFYSSSETSVDVYVLRTLGYFVPQQGPYFHVQKIVIFLSYAVTATQYTW